MSRQRQLIHLTAAFNHDATPNPRRCWKNSTTAPVKTRPITHATAMKIWQNARQWERQTRQKGSHSGIIGRSGLAVLQALIWDFHNWKSGRLDPSIARIAERACMCPRTAKTHLNRLAELGIITWVRRCIGTYNDLGQFHLKQLTNCYGLRTLKQWLGYRDPEPPPPTADTLGSPPPVKTTLEAGAAQLLTDARDGTWSTLMSDQADRLAVALAQFGRAMGAI